MRLVIALLSLVVAGVASAEPLNSTEWKREAAYGVLLLLDYGQTLDIKNHPGMYERNPILGDHPSDARIRNYFLALGAGHLAVTYLLPREYRGYWQYFTIGVQTGYVANNYSIGLRLDF